MKMKAPTSKSPMSDNDSRLGAEWASECEKMINVRCFVEVFHNVYVGDRRWFVKQSCTFE
jgi:hypothetical protein